MFRLMIVIFIGLTSSVAYSNPCISKLSEEIPALYNVKFTETGKGEKDYWKVKDRDEKLYRSSYFARLSGEPWGVGNRDSIVSIAKSEGPLGENTLYRKRDNSAILITGLGGRQVTAVAFDNVTCDVKSVRFYEVTASKYIAEEIKDKAYVAPMFCSFIEKRAFQFARFPKDVETYQCEELNCGYMNQQTRNCSCRGTREPITKPCCAGGTPKGDWLKKLKEEYGSIEKKSVDWDTLSAEFVADSIRRCKKWKMFFNADSAGTSKAKTDR